MDAANLRARDSTASAGSFAKIKRMYPVRVAALQVGFTWLQKQFIKMGLNPEDARWLL